MNGTILDYWGILIPFTGTILGASIVLLLKNEINALFKRFLLGFASGVMIAASVWSLLIPAIEMAEKQKAIPWLPATIGFFLGVGFLLILDNVIPHLHIDDDKPEGLHSEMKKSTMLVLAITLHNIPEGMSVGVVFAGAMADNSTVTVAGAFALAIGMAIQNIPEGAVVSVPLVASGASRKKAYLFGIGSGIVEPIGAILTVLLTSIVVPILPYLLSFAAGAMIYVVVEELIPEAQEGKHSDIAAIGVAIGFVIMMVLDVALG